MPIKIAVFHIFKNLVKLEIFVFITLFVML